MILQFEWHLFLSDKENERHNTHCNIETVKEKSVFRMQRIKSQIDKQTVRINRGRDEEKRIEGRKVQIRKCKRV